MTKLYLALVCAAFIVLAAAGAAGAVGKTRYVSPTGTDAGNCTVSPCRTITYAVGQAADGNTVSVAAGTYGESVSVTKKLSLVGRGATIDAAGFDNGIVIFGAGAAGTGVTGFAVENAGLEGIFARLTSNLTIAGNTLVHNDAYGPFNALCVGNPDDCGEALHLQSVTRSTVSGNLVQDNVGGILLTDEDGPTARNTIRDNRVVDNVLDCGITLASHYFQLGAPVSPGVGGVYQNHVLHNTSNGNGAAGIGVFAGPPGAAAWGNVVSGNTAMNNGLPGVAIHSHTPFQNVDDNQIVNNTLSGNGPDDDAATVYPTGITVFSAVVPIPHTVIAANRISNEYYGIFTVNAVTLSGLPSNKFDSSVVVPISLH
jgi:parallel beta-helix repeat protein